METNVQNFKELQPGTALNGGKYVIERKLGEGGFGITYTAVQRGLNRAVCIKEYFLAGRCVRNTQAKTVHLQGGGEDIFEKYRKAFVKEAQTLASLHHPNIVEVIDIFDENNTSYMVMPFIEGRSLQSIVDKNGPLPYPEAVNYMAQITSAVDYIHKRNILHRDIKPDNIMITADYKAILIDFGSAREFQQDKTQAHTSMLTHGYAPPEQYTANSRKGSYTDIYAIGATLYFILTGQVPLEAAARLTEELVEPIKLNSSIPPEGNYTIMKAMKLKKEERYQTVQEFMDDLKNINHQAPEKEKEKRVRKPFNFKKWVLLPLLGVALLSVSIVATNMIVQHVKEKNRIEKENEQERIHEEQIQKLRDNHETAVREFDGNIEKMNIKENLNEDVDWEGNEGFQNWIGVTLSSLQVIEQCEQDTLFPQLNTNSCFESKLYLFQDKLVKRRIKIHEENKKGLEHGESNPYYKAMREQLNTLDYIIAQIQEGGTLNVKTSL